MKLHLFAFPVLLGLGFSTPATAHAHLDSATPAEGATLDAAPQEVVLVFTEDLEIALSRLTLADAAGTPIETSPLERDAGDPRSLRVTLPEALAPGVYQVEWSAASVDTHSTQGVYRFTLR